MAQKNNSIEMLKKRLIAEMARDKKKATILGVLLLVAVVFVGKLLLKGSPQEVTAATNPMMPPAGLPAPPEAGNPAVDIYPTIGTMDTTPDLIGGGKKITRDIFLPNSSIFPHVLKTTDVNGKVNVVKSKDSAQDVERKRKEELIRAEGAKLHLESAISGRVPIAIINGTVLGHGALINGFRVVKIDSKTSEVELKKDGITIKLGMKE
jgi:hypothetical protein